MVMASTGQWRTVVAILVIAQHDTVLADPYGMAHLYRRLSREQRYSGYCARGAHLRAGNTLRAAVTALEAHSGCNSVINPLPTDAARRWGTPSGHVAPRAVPRRSDCAWHDTRLHAWAPSGYDLGETAVDLHLLRPHGRHGQQAAPVMKLAGLTASAQPSPQASAAVSQQRPLSVGNCGQPWPRAQAEADSVLRADVDAVKTYHAAAVVYPVVGYIHARGLAVAHALVARYALPASITGATSDQRDSRPSSVPTGQNRIAVRPLRHASTASTTKVKSPQRQAYRCPLPTPRAGMRSCPCARHYASRLLPQA